MQIKPEFVVNSRTYNSYSRVKGLPRIHAAMNQLSSSTYIEQYKNSFMKNFGAVGLIVYTEETYTIEEKIGFKNLIDSVYSGAENAGKTIVIDNAGKVDNLGHSPVEADLLKAEAMTGGIIADVMGVPLELVPGYANGSSTYENQREARKSFLVDTVFGVLDPILDDLNAYFFNDGKKIVVMEELVPELKRTDQEIADLWLLSPNERRSLMGFEPIDDENMNKIYIPSGLTPIDEVNGDMGDDVL
jgi:HK97 family phage portal protein